MLLAEADAGGAAEPRRGLRGDRLGELGAGELVIAGEGHLQELKVAVVAAGGLRRGERGSASEREQEKEAPRHARARSACTFRAPRDARPRIRSVRCTPMRPSVMKGPDARCP
jgi:hypothetical protein